VLVKLAMVLASSCSDEATAPMMVDKLLERAMPTAPATNPATKLPGTPPSS
jgi:hypothetical protein